MAVPKYRKSKSKRNMRRAHDFLTNPSMAICSESKQIKRPHYIGPTGFYKGKLVDTVLNNKSSKVNFSESDLPENS